MSGKTIISFKAFFLLTVFFLNTIVGMACALTPHGCCKKYHNRNCCNDSVQKFQQLDKSPEQYFEMTALEPALIIHHYFITPSPVSIFPLRYNVTRQNLPVHDIRVAIRSFQI